MAGWVYLMTNRRNGTLYTGVNSQLPKRAYQHRKGLIEGFRKRRSLVRPARPRTCCRSRGLIDPHGHRLANSRKLFQLFGGSSIDVDALRLLLFSRQIGLSRSGRLLIVRLCLISLC